MESNRDLFSDATWHQSEGGPRYLQLSRHIAQAINEGRFLATGSASEVQDDPDVQAAYLGGEVA